MSTNIPFGTADLDRSAYVDYHFVPSTATPSSIEKEPTMSAPPVPPNPFQELSTPDHANLMYFSTGAVRSKDASDERWDLIPWEGIRRVAKTAAEGAAKYGDNNWLKGIPVSNLLNRAIRHIALYIIGNTDEDHLGHAAWNILAACHMECCRPCMVDVEPQSRKKGESHE